MELMCSATRVATTHGRSGDTEDHGISYFVINGYSHFVFFFLSCNCGFWNFHLFNTPVPKVTFHRMAIFI